MLVSTASMRFFSSSFAFAAGSIPDTWFYESRGLYFQGSYTERFVIFPILHLAITRAVADCPASTAKIQRNMIGTLKVKADKSKWCVLQVTPTRDLWQQPQRFISSSLIMGVSSITRSVVLRWFISILLHIMHSISSTTRATPSFSVLFQE